jgi:hypothetical protein
MSDTTQPDERTGAVLALQISVATVLLALGDLLEKAGQLDDPLRTRWTSVGNSIREALDRAIEDHERLWTQRRR